MYSQPDAHVPGSVVAVSLPRSELLEEPVTIDGECSSSLQEVSPLVSVRARVYMKNDDDTYDVRLENDTATDEAITEEYRSRGDMADKATDLSSRPISSYDAKIRRVRSRDITSSVDSGLSIYWRLLRPEYVKHRGRRILNSLRSIQAKRIRACGAGQIGEVRDDAGYTDKTDDSSNIPCVAIAKAFDSEYPAWNVSQTRMDSALQGRCGYNQADVLLGCDLPDPASIHRSFSSPLQSATYMESGVMMKRVLPLSRNASTSAVVRRAEFRMSSDMVELTQDDPTRDSDGASDLDLDDLPSPPRLCQTASDLLYENMPHPDDVIDMCRADSLTTTDDNDMPMYAPEMQRRLSSWALESIANSPVDADDLLARFKRITGVVFGAAVDYAIPLSPDALSSFSKSDPECEVRNHEVEVATSLLIQCIVPALVRSYCHGVSAWCFCLFIVFYV